MKKIMLLVPDGVGIKNYLYSKTFKSDDFDITLLHNFEEETLENVSKTFSYQNAIELPTYKESLTEKFLRELIHLSRLKSNAKKVNNKSILRNWNPKKRTFSIRCFYKLVELVSKFTVGYNTILFLEKKYKKALTKNNFYSWSIDFLRKEQPDIVFCTHQRALKVPTIYKAAEKLGITRTTVIYSWDNLPKARLPFTSDFYFVWSSYMEKELMLYYPEIDKNQIVITGTPQFEFYFDKENILPKDVFYATYNLDPNKKLICYSGDDVRTSPHDPEYIEDIVNAIIEAGMEDSYQIIFRRCPVDVSGRFEEIVSKYPDLIKEAPPLWNFKEQTWTTVYPTIDDVKLLVSLCYYADTVVNVGSTMAFDFGMFGKPCIFINYDQESAKNWSVKTIYQYQHFKSMPNKNVVLWLNSREEIIEKLRASTTDNEVNVDDWFNVIVNYPDTASNKIAEKLKTV